MQHFLKPLPRTARTRIIASQFLDQFLVAMNHALTALDVCFGWIPLAPLAGDLKSLVRRQSGRICYRYA
jgi:hypothetical protein